MSPLPVVMPQPTRAVLLLLLARGLGLDRDFSLVDPMELLVRAILAWPARGDEFHRDPQLHPPRAQARQTRRTRAAKGRAVVSRLARDPKVLAKLFERHFATGHS